MRLHTFPALLKVVGCHQLKRRLAENLGRYIHTLPVTSDGNDCRTTVYFNAKTNPNSTTPTLLYDSSRSCMTSYLRLLLRSNTSFLASATCGAICRRAWTSARTLSSSATSTSSNCGKSGSNRWLKQSRTGYVLRVDFKMFVSCCMRQSMCVSSGCDEDVEPRLETPHCMAQTEQIQFDGFSHEFQFNSKLKICNETSWKFKHAD